MNVVILLWRARLRRSKRAVAALAILFAIGGGVALAVGAGARRTAGAYEEVQRTSNVLDVGVGYGPHDPREVERLVAEQPGIDATTFQIGFGGRPSDLPPASILYFVAHWQDPIRVDRPIVLEGRVASNGSEVFLNEAAAAGSGLKVGDRFTFLVSNSTYDDFRPVELHVVGIGLIPDEVVEDQAGAKPAAILHRQFVLDNYDRISWGNAQLRFRPGADRGAVLDRLAQHGFFTDETSTEDRRRVDDAMRPLVVTLGVLCLLAALAVVLVVGQAVSRICRREEADERSLFAAGCGRRHLIGADVLMATTVGASGSLGAVGVAIAASPFFPVGRVSRIEPLRGLDIDGLALTIGSVTLAASLVALVSFATWRRSGAAARRPRPGSAPSWLATDPGRSTGLRFASGRRGVTGTVASLVAGLATVIAAVMFTESVGRLLEDPSLSGFNWDVMARTSFSPLVTQDVQRTLADERDLERATAVGFLAGSLTGPDVVPVSVWQSLRGSPWPPLIDGRSPQAQDEILIGRETLDRHKLSIGDRVPLALDYFTFAGESERSSLEVTIVGVAVSPAIGLAGTDTPRLDEGLLMRAEDLRRVSSDESVAGIMNVLLFEVSEGAKSDALRYLQTQFPDGVPNVSGVPTEWFTAAQPAELSQAGSARATIGLAVLALLVAIVGVNVHSLLGFVRQRGRAYVVLKALGFTPRQVRSSVFWQSSVVVVAAITLALPLGIAGGRVLGRAFADAVGVLHPSVFPFGVVALSAIGLFVVVQAAATLPASRANRATASRDLRAE